MWTDWEEMETSLREAAAPPPEEDRLLRGRLLLWDQRRAAVVTSLATHVISETFYVNRIWGSGSNEGHQNSS